jgi:hypothetical protein
MPASSDVDVFFSFSFAGDLDVDADPVPVAVGFIPPVRRVGRRIGIGLVAMASFGGAADVQAQRRRAALPELRVCCVAARFVVH